ncbi:MAG: hypothetical protein IJ728_01045, partial [Selenomonadaceae bacterium]|nr:hypothetical protein [Selenomonadaceae bacterium]
NDTINNTSSGDYSSLSGGSGNDSINAGSNSYSVTLNGGYGNDTLIGSYSTYYGDVFQFGNRDDYDVITNYSTNDTIHLTNTYSLSASNYYNVGNDRVISLASDGVITVKGGASKNINIKLANGSMSTIYSSTSSYEERNSVEEHWFTADDKVVEASDIETILQPTTTNDFSVEDIEFKDINNIFTTSINTTQLKKTNKK